MAGEPLTAPESRAPTPQQALTHAGFAVLRTPLRPLQEFFEWSSGLTASAVDPSDRVALAAAIERDRAVLEDRLRHILSQPDFSEALLVASRDLHEAASRWLEGTRLPDVRRTAAAIARYFARATFRCTPFGLFAGCSMVAIGDVTRLEIGGRGSYRRHTRIDMGYVDSLVRHLANDDVTRAAFPLKPNSSLWEAAGRLHYVETRHHEHARSYSLVAAECTPELRDVLTRAAGGATADALAEGLVDGEITIDEARAFIRELLDTHLLQPDLEPPVTGVDAALALALDLERHGVAEDVAQALRQAIDALQRLDANGVAGSASLYKSVTETIASLPVLPDRGHLYQVDMFKPAPSAVLGEAVVEEAIRAIEVLQPMSEGMDVLEDFARRFEERYERAEVRLIEALDEEVGIGLTASPALPTLQRLRQLSDGARARDAVLAEIRLGAVQSGQLTVELRAEDIRRLSRTTSLPVPDALAVFCTLLADGDDFRLAVTSITGPSGARMLGRFAHLDAGMCREIGEYLDTEEALRPDAVFAEVVHLPQGRVGNVLARPVLREYEIPYLGRAGVAEDRQIPITDLTLAIDRGRLVLRSQRLGREVIPRLTSAHGYSQEVQLPVYRFLGLFQNHRTNGWLAWDWGYHRQHARFLPRITMGRLILSPACWQLSAAELEKAEAAPVDRFAAVRRLARGRELPRYVVLSAGDNQIPIDLENIIGVEILLQALKKHSTVTLTEPLASPEQLAVSGPEGLFTHEIIIPLVAVRSADVAVRDAKASAASSEPPQLALATASTATVRRQFAPGTEWTYAKLYCGRGMIDHVLRSVVAPLVRSLSALIPDPTWFFIRYGDPDQHVRFRVRLPGDCAATIMHLIHEATEPALQNRLLSKVVLDTYVREVERYGGPHGIELCERLFHFDSEAALFTMLGEAPSADDNPRRLMTLAGIHQWLEDFAIPISRRLALLGMRRPTGELRRTFGKWFREVRKDIVAAMDSTGSERRAFATALSHRSARSRPVIDALKSAEAAHRLSAPCDDIVFSLTHMSANRFLRSGNDSEPMLYDALARHYESIVAQARQSRSTEEAAPPVWRGAM